MSSVSVYTYTHSVTYVADNILKSMKDIIRLSGLNPESFVDSWATYKEALTTWIESRHLELVMLEIFHPDTDDLITRWDIDVVYTWSSDEGSFWTDTDGLRYHIIKAGIAPEKAKYRMLLRTKPGEPAVPGWGSASSRSTIGFVRQSIGTTVEHNGLGGNASYWRKT